MITTAWKTARNQRSLCMTDIIYVQWYTTLTHRKTHGFSQVRLKHCLYATYLWQNVKLDRDTAFSSFLMEQRETFRLPRNETAGWNNYLRHPGTQQRGISLSVSSAFLIFLWRADREQKERTKEISLSLSLFISFRRSRSGPVDSFGRFLRNSSLQ